MGTASEAWRGMGRLLPAALRNDGPTSVPLTEEVPIDESPLEVEIKLRTALMDFELNGQYEVSSSSSISKKAGPLFDLVVKFIRIKSATADKPVLERKPEIEISAEVPLQDEAEPTPGNEDDELTFKSIQLPKPKRTFYAEFDISTNRVTVKSKLKSAFGGTGYEFYIKRYSITQPTPAILLAGCMKESEITLLLDNVEVEEDGEIATMTRVVEKEVTTTSASLHMNSNAENVGAYASSFIVVVNDILTEFGTPEGEELSAKRAAEAGLL